MHIQVCTMTKIMTVQNKHRLAIAMLYYNMYVYSYIAALNVLGMHKLLISISMLLSVAMVKNKNFHPTWDLNP